MTCPTDIELARARSVGIIPDHLASCEACRAAWEATSRVIELARELPAPVPSAAHREEIRTALLAASPTPAARSPRRWWIPAIGVAAAAAAAIVLIPRAAPTVAVHAHGDVTPHPGAHYVALSRSPDEIVRLVDGAIDVEVEPLHPGERFRVVVGDAEVEVHGTAFTVDAAADHLVAVTVAHGRVEVRPRASVPAVLGAGQSWHVPPVRTAAVAPPPPPVVVIAPPPLRTVHVERPHAAPVEAPPPPVEPMAPPVAKSSDEVAYEDGWAAMRAQDYGKAAAAFSRVLLLAPDSTLVEDAAYWHAVALARGKRSAEAVSAFRDFLDEHAASPRAGEASAMLGWLLVDTHDYDEALRRFHAATGDRDPKVRASAQAGIDALAKRK